jgi:uncharacterized protein (TIGR00725 family)
MKVAVFGSANAHEGEDLYDLAYLLGKLLAEDGHTVMTGGYCGTMEATSRGAEEAGGHTIGVTSDEIEAFRPGGPNAWVREVIPSVTLGDRIAILTRSADAFIALPGGVGTLVEVAMAYNLIAIGAIRPRHLIVIGEGWKLTFDAFFKGQNANVNASTRAILQFAPDAQSAVALLQQEKE